MRNIVKNATVTALVSVTVFASYQGANAQNLSVPVPESRKIEFPRTKSGDLVLAIDPHTHSVFSDGHVWLSVRVWEAVNDGLDAFAVTEHIEFTPFAEDIPIRDGNRPFEIATNHVNEEDLDLIVINGAEITADYPPGHVNAIFLNDADAVRKGSPVEKIVSSKEQDAFVFWNHPFWPADFTSGIPEVSDLHLELFDKKLVDGIEVTNRQRYSDRAFAIALQYDLAILGGSDIHKPVEYIYDYHKGDHRTVTLVLAKERTAQGIKDAFEAHRTVAFFKHTLVGREQEIREVVEAAMSLEISDYVVYNKKETEILNVIIHNKSSTNFLLRNISDTGFYYNNDVVTVPALGQITLSLTNIKDLSDVDLKFQVMNAYIAPRQNLIVEFN